MSIRHAFIAAPILMFCYGVIRIIDGLDGSRGPGLAWTTGHLAFLAALALFVPIFRAMREMAGRGPIATTSLIVGYAGLAALFAQFGIDIVVGFLAADKAAMSVAFEQVKSVPGLEPLVYMAGPSLFYIGQLTLVTLLAIKRRAKAWTPVLVLVNVIVPLTNKDLIPLGAICLLVCLLSLAPKAVVPAAGQRTPVNVG